MTTLGQQILERLQQLETAVTDMQLNAPGPRDAQGTGMQFETLRQQVRDEMANLRREVESSQRGEGSSDRRFKTMHPKDCMPGILGSNYKQDWRTWSYKTRDWLSQMDDTLTAKLETIESQTKELSPEFIESLNISPQVDSEIRRFLVHRLEGDPAEVIREKASQKKSGLEQYRCLSQLCDPAAAARNMSDSKHLFHPPPASSVQTLLARIAEWKNLEIRCKARSGEVIPASLGTRSLLEMCPSELQKTLYAQPTVANGTISFDDLEALL